MTVTRSAVLAAAVVVASLAVASPAAAHAPSWQDRPTGVDARLRGLDAVSRDIAWVSGSGGTVLRTTDGGASWRNVGPPDTANLQFRDVHAFDSRNAVILSIGTGTDSRIYRTRDGGAHWQLAFTNDHPDAFYDCMTFFDHRHGLALSDPVDGRFRILSTRDGGASWHVLPTGGMPDALPGEFAFAASGTCLVSSGRTDAWFATGGGEHARVFHSRDRGRTWTVTATAVRSGPSAGIYSLAFRDRRHGLAIGGDFTTPDVAPDALALTRDAGRGWTLVTERAPGEYRSGAAWIPRRARSAIVVGPTGSDHTTDGGHSWTRFDDGSLDAVDCAPDGGCWGSGAAGRVTRLAR